ncbi:glycosyltransferase involved in cell wall biosynthesis [Bradyrhizobium sp. AZCC 1578]|uniref:glycosyltransferase family 4 protein n=1 Tax=Bradyrhizobium sp. AZCC 1578 TaxID=3117027 RepID=UPI002FEFE351
MKLLFCCESYWPHQGGVQVVMRQIAERMAAAGHEVSVATRVHPDRKTKHHNGVHIHDFEVSGNLVTGIRGEVDRYRQLLTSFDGDAILIKAAQQWSFDALWPVLDQIKARKVFVPCGFSSFYEPSFKSYFQQLPDILRKFDHLIFYAEHYRDIDFARASGITSFSIIPNGASEVEFARETRRDGRLRRELGIPTTDLVFLTVGAPINAKGHETVAEAFAQVDTAGRDATLILNGNWPPPGTRFRSDHFRAVLQRFASLNSMRKGVRLFREAGMRGVIDRLFPKPPDELTRIATVAPALPASTDSPQPTPSAPRSAPAKKTVLRLDLPRHKVVDAFFEADLFVFASKVEYSPLVLFESAAAGTPFLTVPAGNAGEIVRWTGGGWLCPADADDRGYIKVSPSVLAREMEKGIHAPDRLRELGDAGRRAWRERFTWSKIAHSYERVLRGETVVSPMYPEAAERAVNG